MALGDNKLDLMSLTLKPDNKSANWKSINMGNSGDMDLISNVQVIPVKSSGKGNCRAYVMVDIAGKYRIKNIRIIQGERGLFVVMPQMKKEKDGKSNFVDLIKPIDQAAREDLKAAVLNEYNRVIDKKITTV